MSLFAPLGQNCKEPHTADLYRPIRQVMAEHPQLDGNCYYKWYADYLGDPTNYADMFLSTIAQFSQNLGKGPLTPYYLPNGEILTSHWDGNWGNYAYDDVMCYQMGWLKGQRLDKHIDDLQNREAWLNLAEQECARLPAMVEEGLDDTWTNLTIGYMEDDNGRICNAANCLTSPNEDSCKKATVRDWVYHLYPKCLLGGERLTGAASQIAWCFARACVTEGNVIKHASDCWPDNPFRK